MPFSDARADHAIEFMSHCPHIKGESAKQGLTLGDTWMDWQVEGLRELFGRVDEDGYRQYRIAFWFLPKKHGKSTLASAVALYGLFADQQEGPEVYSVAGDRDQAARVFDIAAKMRERLPDLLNCSGIKEHLKTISYPANTGFYKVLASDPRGTHGIIPSMVIFDEIHTQRDRRMWAAIDESMRTKERREPLLFVISHAGEDPEGLWYELYEHAKKVQAGEREDPKFFPLVYGAEPGDDWTDPEVWRKAMPALGHLVDEDEVRAACQRARFMPSAEYDFRRFQLNQPLEGGVGWIDLQEWDKCDAEPDVSALVGRECYAGLDLSTTTDLSALALWFPHEDGTHDVLCWFWVPGPGAEERGRGDRAPYLEWIDRGLICATPDEMIDYQFIRACLVGPKPLVTEAVASATVEVDAEEALWRAKQRLARAGLPPDGLAARYRIVEVAYDPYNATQLVLQLEHHDGLRMVETRQAISNLNAPMRDIEGLVASRRLRHGGNPVLRHHVGNVKVSENAMGNVQPDKRRSRGRIDGVAAMIMARQAAMLHWDDDGDTIDEGVRWLATDA